MKFLQLTFTLLFFLFCSLLIAQKGPQIEKSYLKTTQKLLKNKKIKAAFNRIEQLDALTVQRHIELTEIEAPPFKETKRAKVFADYFNELGMDSFWIDTEGNVLGLLRGSKGERTVALDAHLDTVFPE